MRLTNLKHEKDHQTRKRESERESYEAEFGERESYSRSSVKTESEKAKVEQLVLSVRTV